MFQTSTPAIGPAFENRVSELAVLGQALEKLQAGVPQWVAVIGPRKIGKTSLVLEAGRRAHGGRLSVVALDAQEWASISPEFFRRMALRVLDGTIGRETGESLEGLALNPAAYRGALLKSEAFAALPPALRVEVTEIPDGRVVPERIPGWLDLPQRLAEALDLHVAVAIDEFQELASLAGKGFEPFALMRSVWQKHTRVGYFISGSARSMLLSLLNKEHSPFFHHFAILELGPFDRPAAIRLLQRHAPPEQQIPLPLAEQAVDTLGGNPFYLQLLGEALTGRSLKPGPADLKSALQSVLFSPTGRLALFLENEFNRLVGRSAFLAATLDALAEGPSTVTAVADKIQAPTGATVRYIERLKDAVIRDGEGRYMLSDSTFALWLRWRRPGGTVVPMAVVGDEAEQAVARAIAAMGFDLVYQSKASRGAFDLLALRGATQLGIQVKRSRPPLVFKPAEWDRMDADAGRYGWQWILAAVDEKQNVLFLDPAKASKGKTFRIGVEARIANLLKWVDGDV